MHTTSEDVSAPALQALLSGLQAVADRVDIEALRGEFADAVLVRDYDCLASLFAVDGAVRMPHIGAEAAGREEIRATAERLQGMWDYLRRLPNPATRNEA